MFTRQFAITALCFLAICVGVALSIRSFTQSRSTKQPEPTVASVELGDTRLRFPKGVVLDAGTVQDNATAHCSLSFINDGPGRVDLARFQICETCYAGVRLTKSTQRVAAGESGTLEFELTTGIRAGRTTVNAQVEYSTLDPQPETSKNPRFAVQLSFANDSPGVCHWEHQKLDFGDLTSDASSLSRKINLIEQLRSDLTPQIRLRTEGGDDVSANVVSERDAPSVFNRPGTTYEVEIKLQPRAGETGPRRAFVIAETPLGDRKLEVQWNSVTDYVLRPASGVFLTSPNKALVQVVSVKSVRAHVFQIVSAICDIPSVEVVVGDSRPNAISQTVAVRVPAGCPIANGQLTVRLREQSGDEHEEILKCRIVSLAAEPTPAVAE